MTNPTAPTSAPTAPDSIESLPKRIAGKLFQMSRQRHGVATHMEFREVCEAVLNVELANHQKEIESLRAERAQAKATLADIRIKAVAVAEAYLEEAAEHHAQLTASNQARQVAEAALEALKERVKTYEH